jgi:hypothetical protein
MIIMMVVVVVVVVVTRRMTYRRILNSGNGKIYFYLK